MENLESNCLKDDENLKKKFKKRKFNQIDGEKDTNSNINGVIGKKSKKSKADLNNADGVTYKIPSDLNDDNGDSNNNTRIDGNKEEDKKMTENDIKYLVLKLRNNTDSFILSDLKNGKRIFNNKTEIEKNYSKFNKRFIEFKQLLYPNLLLNEDLTENNSEVWTMQSALFSTFVIEDDFIYPLIFKNKLKTIIVKHEDNNYSLKIQEKNFENFFVKIINPKLDYTSKWGKFHSKLTIFKFEDFIRIIIPTANLTGCDWYYWGQIVWFQDFPVKSKNPENKNDDNNNEFLDYLKEIINTMIPNYNALSELDINLDDYDYSNASIDLVASTVGRFAKNEMSKYGVSRVKSLLDKYKKVNIKEDSKNENNKIIVQCSSFGRTLKDKFIDDLCSAFNVNSKLKDFQIIYPTINYINSFELGPELTGCLFLGKDTFETSKNWFRKLEPALHFNDKTVFHSKFIITGDKENIGICYIGSHNLSPSAWGNYEKKDTQISMANYELGLLFNPLKVSKEEMIAIYDNLPVKIENLKKFEKEDVPFTVNF